MHQQKHDTMNRFEKTYRYAKFKVTSNGHLILDELTYIELCQWLNLMKNHLFGHLIERKGMAEFWDAENFLRYETNLFW